MRRRTTIALKLTRLAVLWLCSASPACHLEVPADNPFARALDEAPSRMTDWPQDAPKTRALLAKYQPRLFVAPDSYKPMDFYRDYLPRCALRYVGSATHEPVTRERLAAVHREMGWYLDFEQDSEATLAMDVPAVHPTFYGRVCETSIELPHASIPLIFLKYSAVYPLSGLPDTLGTLKELGIWMIADRNGFHELDIHGAITVILHAETHEPFGLLIAQHNYQRAMLAGVDFPWPEDDRVMIAVGRLSNEPYLHLPGMRERLVRTVGDPFDLAWLLGRSDDTPIGGAYDRVPSPEDGALEVEMALELLPLDDPLYRAWIPLGERKKIWGIASIWYMQGPPGMDYYTLPELKDFGDLFTYWHIDPADETFWSLAEANLTSFDSYDMAPLLEHQRRRLAEVLGP